MTNQWTNPKFAEDYAESAINPSVNWYEYEVNLPDLIKMLPSGIETLLDFGSGPGDITDRLNTKLPKVDGCDSSEAMLDLSKKNFPAVSFFKWNGSTPLADKMEYYDCVFSKLTVHFIEDLDTFAANLTQILKTGGSFVFSVPHPMRSAREIGDASYWQQVNYEEEIGKYGITATFIHRSIQDYFRPFAANGFVLTDISEPVISPEVMNKYSVEPAYASIPRRLNWRFQKA